MLSLLRTHGDRIFLRHVDAALKTEELSYKDFFLHSLITASLYDRFKVPIGGTVILVLSNPKDVFLAVSGALLTGRIPIVSAHPSPKLTLTDFGRTLLTLMENAEPALIVGDPAYCSYLSSAIGRRVASFNDIETPRTLPQIAHTGNPVLFIQYSSGTTGTKKGVAISQDQLLWQVDTYAREIGLAGGDHIVSWLPYYHDMGLITSLMTPLLTGVPITVMSAFDWVKNPLMLLKIISRDRGTITWLPNFAYNFLAQAAQRADLSGIDLSSLRGVVNCSEPVSAASHQAFLDAFTGSGFRPTALAASYAMAETTFAITSAGFGHPLRTDHIERSGLAVGAQVGPGSYAAVSSGHALPGTDVRIFSSERTVLGDRMIGEIGVRSPSLMDGYFKNAEATVKSFHEDFFLTGDLGYMDRGDVFVTGRIKDLIITAGRNIYPQDIEAAVADVPGTIAGRCVAFGVEDASKGTESVVIVAETGEADAQKLARAISQAVTLRFDISLADVLVVESGWLKKSTSGKIARSQNRDRYLAHKKTSSDAGTIDPASVEGRIQACVHKIAGTWVKDLEAPLVTSGLIDSLGLTNLIMALEDAFQKTLLMPDEAGYDAYDTIAAIAALVSRESTAHAEPGKAKPPAMFLAIDPQVKANNVLDGDRNFDGLVLGSSRSYLVQAKRMGKFGLRSFHFSTAGSRIEDSYCKLRFFTQTNRTPLKHIILGIDPLQFSPTLPLDLRLEQSPSLFALLDESDRLGQNGLKLDASRRQLSAEALARHAQIRYDAWDTALVFDTKTGDVIQLFGQHIATMPVLKFSIERVNQNWPKNFMMANEVKTLHPRRLYYLSKIMSLTQELGCKVSIYTNPLHPDIISRLRDATPYIDKQLELVALIKETAHAGVTVHSFLTPADFGGDNDDYYDGLHIGRHNGDILVDYLLSKAGYRAS